MKRALLLLVVLLAPAVAGTTETEFFDNDATGSVPDESWYDLQTSGSGGFFVATDQATSTPKSFKLNGAGATTAQLVWAPLSTFTASSTASEAQAASQCRQGRLDFNFRVDTLPAAAQFYRFFMVSAVQGHTTLSAQMNIDSTGAVTVVATMTGVSNPASTIGGLTIAPDTWYPASISIFPDATTCSNRVQFTVGSSSVLHNGGGTWCSGNPEVGFCTHARWTQFQFAASSWSSPAENVWIDNVTVSGVGTAFGSIASPTSTVAVTNLVGFDVDPSGTTAVARTDSGDFVRGYNGITLVEKGDFDTGCSRVDGIMSEKDIIGFFDCDTGMTNDPNFLRLRSADMGSPTIKCVPDCAFTLDMDLRQEGACGAGFPSRINMAELGEIEFAKITYDRKVEDQFPELDSHAVAWAFDTTTGKVGVAEYTAQSLGCDDKEEQSVGYSPDTPNQICSWVVGNTQKIAAVSSDSTTQIFTWTPKLETGDDGFDAALKGDITGPQIYPALNGADSVGCGGTRLMVKLASAVAGQDDLFMLDQSTSAILWKRDVLGSGGGDRSVALSGNGVWFAYRDGSETLIGYASNGTVTARITNPAGTLYNMKMDYNGDNLWIANTASINRYTITPFTNVNPTCVGCDPPPTLTVGGDDPGPGAFGGAPAQVGSALGIGTFGGGLFLAALTVLMFAVAAFTEGGNVKLFGYIGAVVGFFVAWGFGFISTGAVFAIIVICGLIWYVSRGSSTGG